MNRNSSGRRYDREFKNNAVALVRALLDEDHPRSHPLPLPVWAQRLVRFLEPGGGKWSLVP
jgi:hypothetical protein